MSTHTSLFSLCPLDGRYQTKITELQKIGSEYGLMYYRLIVEIRWLQALSQEPNIKEVPPLSQNAIAFLDTIVTTFNEKSALRIKEIEATTNHDVKAIEYFLKETLAGHSELSQLTEFVHFACTSEDINNLAYALMVKDIRRKVLLPEFANIQSALKKLIDTHQHTPMLSRTHGQPASPTTLGKEIANVLFRLQRQIHYFEAIPLLGKINGAVGNFNAHHVAYPDVNWIGLSESFVTSLGLSWNALTTQIEPHDYLADYFDCLSRINTVLIDFCRDMWGYIALNYFTQIPVAGEVGSSTMPHKVNPIDFENAEGNFGIANALFTHFSQKLPVSRWQRDLTDSTVLRNIGMACGYTLVALKSIARGLTKVSVNTAQLETDLWQNWEVLGEALQTVMRRYGIESPYEKLKALTRGKRITQENLHLFIDSLVLPENVKQNLKSLTPSSYIGLASELLTYLDKK